MDPNSILDLQILDLQYFFFNNEVQIHNVKKLCFTTLLCACLSKFMKLVHAMVHTMKFLEEKNDLSTLTFMKLGLCITRLNI